MVGMPDKQDASWLAASGSPLVGNVGHIEVKALDWSQAEQREAFADTKWDYILAAGGPSPHLCTSHHAHPLH